MKKFMKVLTLMLVVATIAALSITTFVACNKDKDKDVDLVKKIDINLTDEDYAFGVSKENTELLSQINAAYAELVEEGKIEEINNAYFGGGEVSPVKTYSLDGSKNQLVVATEAGFAPFEYMDGENLYGIDMAIMAEIAKKLNKELVVQNMMFDAVVTSVQTGECDVAAAALTVTPDRAEKINFTTTYYQASQVLVVAGDNTKFDDCKTVEDVMNVLNELPNGTKAAFQKGTTGDAFVKAISNLSPQSYQKVGLAATDLVNGNIELIVVDKAPADAIVKSVNKK